MCLKETLDHPAVKILVAHLTTEAWRARLKGLPGYDIDTPGQIVSLTRTLPWYRLRRTKRIA